MMTSGKTLHLLLWCLALVCAAQSTEASAGARKYVVDLRSGETVSADESGKFSVRVESGRWKMLKISGKGSL